MWLHHEGDEDSKDDDPGNTDCPEQYPTFGSVVHYPASWGILSIVTLFCLMMLIPVDCSMSYE